MRRNVWGAGIVKFVAVVTLNCLDCVVKLCLHIAEKVRERERVRESGECFRFKPQRKGPEVV